MVRSVLVALLSTGVLAAFAEQPGRVYEIYRPDAANVSVIVELRDEPLLARGRTRIAANARESLDARFAQLERDLATIDRSVPRGRVASAATDAPVLTARYSHVFAGAAATVRAEAVPQIRALGYVRAVHLDRPMKKMLEHSVPKIEAPAVWSSFGTRGKDVVVAVIDTGIDYDHPAFGGFGAGKRVAGGYDFVNRDGDPMDDDGHGTHVAGIIAGNGGGVVGVAPEATLLAYKVLNQNGSGPMSVILSAVERAADPNQDGNSADRVHVVNLSLGGPGGPEDPLSKAVETASAAGIVFCIAAGNDGDFQEIGSPGGAPSAITVGASSLADELADFSSKGPVPESLAIKPEVVAPGVDIISAQAGGGTLEASGTSMATPHVAGVAALLRAIHPQWTAAQIKAAIVGTAKPLGGEAMAEGAGRVDALRAATADILAVQSVLNLGAADANAAHWTPAVTLTLVNLGNTTRTLALAAPSPRAGIGVTLDATSLELAPGASKDVRVSFDVDQAQVPAPTEGSLSYSGAIQIAGGASPLTVPWAFVKGTSVTIDYDGPEPYEAFLANSASTDVQRIIAESPGAASRIVPVGTYDVTLFPTLGDPQIVLIREQQTLAGATTVPIRRADAKHVLTLSAQDEKGQPLADSECERFLAVLAPQQSDRGTGVMVVQTYTTFLMSQASERYTFAPSQRCTAQTRDHAYAGALPVLRGMNASQTAVIRADEWIATPLAATFPATIQDPTAGIFVGWLWHSTFASSASTVARTTAVDGTSWGGTLYLTPQRHPDITAAGRIVVSGQIPTPLRRAVESPLIQAGADGNIVVSPVMTPNRGTYVARPGERLSFGEGPAFLRLILSTNNFTLIRPEWRGALDEDRYHMALDSALSVRDSAGTVLISGRAIPAVIYAPTGRHELTASAPIRVRGIDGTASLVATFDGGLDDNAPPTLNALRILDANGFNVSSLSANASGSLVLTAIDVDPDDEGVALTRTIRTDSLRVQWRAHGTTQWTELPATLLSTGETENPPGGATYSANLAATTRAGAGAIDLSIRFEDPVGNSYEWTLAPAFTVTTRLRGRAVRH